MKKIILILVYIGFFLTTAESQTIDQKLSLVSNQRTIGGQFIVDYQIEGTGLGTARTLGSLNVDVIYDTTVLQFGSGSNWISALSDSNGYSKSIKSNSSESGSYKSIRIIVTAPYVNDSTFPNANGYDISDNYVTIVTINFNIVSVSNPATLSIKSVTNQIGLFNNPHNQPNTCDISSYTLSDPTIINEPMPVELAMFASVVNKNDVTLNWKTTIEINNHGFDIERKNDNDKNTWSQVGFVSGTGYSNTGKNYSYTDKNLNSGNYSYRLKQIDNNGNFKYYSLNNSVKVGVPKKFNISQNYPNPFNPATKIDFEVPVDSKVDIKIYDITGREIKTLLNENKQAGYYTVELNAGNLASGNYFYRVTCDQGQEKYVETKKMTLVK